MDSTACGAAFFRATETLMDNHIRIVTDEYAHDLLPYKYRLFLYWMRNRGFRNKMMDLRQKITPGIYGSIICRTRYIDDCVQQSIKNGAKIVVNLGVGLDTRSVRLSCLQAVPYYEIDKTDVVAYKQNAMMKAMKKKGLLHSKGTYYIPTDFESDDLVKALSEAGYSFNDPTFFILEGVTQYISKKAFRDNLSIFMSAAKGSDFVFTYVPSEIFAQYEHNPNEHLLLRQFKKIGIKKLTSYSMSDINSLHEEHNLKAVENIGSFEYNTRYLIPLNRKLEVAPLERIVYAKLK